MTSLLLSLIPSIGTPQLHLDARASAAAKPLLCRAPPSATVAAPVLGVHSRLQGQANRSTPKSSPIWTRGGEPDDHLPVETRARRKSQWLAFEQGTGGGGAQLRRSPALGPLVADDFENLLLELRVAVHHGELRICLRDLLRRAEQNASLRSGQHGSVVEGIAHRDDAEVEALELLHRLQLLVLQPHDVLGQITFLVRLQEVGEDHGVAKLVKNRQRVLLETIREDEGTRDRGLQPLQEVSRTRQDIELVDDVEDILQLHAVFSQRVAPSLHQLGEIRLLRGGDLQLLDASLLLNRKPRLRCQGACDVANHQPHGPLRDVRERGQRRQLPGHHPHVGADHPTDLHLELVVAIHYGELRMGLHYPLAGAVQDAALSGREHRDVVEGVADRDDAEIHPLERLHGLSLLVLQPQLVADDEALLVYDEGVAEDAGSAQLLEHRHGILLEGVRQQKDAGHNGL
mmetsp:Transcript_61390/g.180072  ORF Transcript_61390/g.180072 Transcript_61390/m.180072 type:complete len:458 (-) Transcript_61390:374-1747(-)